MILFICFTGVPEGRFMTSLAHFSLSTSYTSVPDISMLVYLSVLVVYVSNG